MLEAKAGDYSNTSVEFVLSKIKHKDNYKIYKGYFPKSAREVNEGFCFVILDLFEQPIKDYNFLGIGDAISIMIVGF